MAPTWTPSRPSSNEYTRSQPDRPTPYRRPRGSPFRAWLDAIIVGRDSERTLGTGGLVRSRPLVGPVQKPAGTVRLEVAIPDFQTTAVVIVLPTAEPLLTTVRTLVPQLVRALPPHVSVLYPGPDPTAQTVDDVSALARYVPREIELTQVEIGDQGFVGVTVPALDDLLQTYRTRWPSLVPYGGRYGTAPAAHMTLVMGATAGQAARISAAVAEHLPKTVRTQGPYFMEYGERGWIPITASG